MDLLPLMQSRRSVRSYTDEPVTPEQLDTILAAGLLAPSGRNIRPVEFVVVDDPQVLAQLATCKAPAGEHVADAACAIVVIGDANASDTWIEDCSIALEHLHLAAADLGLGSCWIQVRCRQSAAGTDAQDAVRELLSIPARFGVLGVLAIGVPAKQPSPHDLPNTFCDKVHRNGL